MTEESFSVCLTFDFDAMSLWINAFGTDNIGMISRGEFGAVGVERILALAKKHDVPLSFMVPGHTAYCYPDLVKRMHSEGHEIGHHGWAHENPSDKTKDEERGILERGFEALERCTGEKPIGYRSPAWNLSQNSIDLLLEYEIVYDSSCMASDFSPYYLRKGDKISRTEPFVFGECSELVELPVSWTLDDWPAFDYVIGGYNTGLMPPSAVRENWQSSFDYMVANCPGGIYILTMHPQVTGRAHVIGMLDSFITHMKDTPGVKFERLGDCAVRWKTANPLEQWKKDHPHMTGAAAFAPES